MSRAGTIAVLIAVATLAAVTSPAAADDADLPQQWVPPAPEGLPELWDWIQLTSLEWLKGEVIALYDEVLEFDSDELDVLSIDWEDIKRVRTARLMEMRFRNRSIVRGRLFVEDERVRIVPLEGDAREFDRFELVSATVGSPKEIDHWKMKVSLGANKRTGNSEVSEANLNAKFVRRSATNRIDFSYIGNYNLTEGELVSNNHRATGTWDRFVTDRVFATPVSVELFRDPFQNIDVRSTFSIGIGYHIIDGKKSDWTVSGGPGFQRTRFDDVPEDESDTEDTPAFTITTTSDIELTKWMDFLTEYRFQLNNETSGSYNHHMMIAFETDITSLLDFDIQWVWDRIEKPRQNSDGSFPEQDDFRLIVALGFDF